MLFRSTAKPLSRISTLYILTSSTSKRCRDVTQKWTHPEPRAQRSCQPLSSGMTPRWLPTTGLPGPCPGQCTPLAQSLLLLLPGVEGWREERQHAATAPGAAASQPRSSASIHNPRPPATALSSPASTCSGPSTFVKKEMFKERSGFFLKYT